MATPPIRGTGRSCTRGRSDLSSTAPIRGATRATTGVSTSTRAAATPNPSATSQSSRARSASSNDMRAVIAGPPARPRKPPDPLLASSALTETVSRGAAFADRIRTREARVGIVGLGYAGLPLAMAFAEAGLDVTGIDLSDDRVRAIAERRSYLVDVPADRYDGLDGRLRATTNYAAVGDLDALTICVPTPMSKTRTPDISYVVAAAESVAENLQSTTYPGTTEEIVLPILERTGAKVGRDVFLGYAPERVDPGNARWTIRNTPKLVSGVTDECRARTETLYREIVDTVVPCSSPTVAETAKLHENTFRAVNIALANELALMCDRLGISAWEVIEAASTKPFAFLPHYPGPGLGGDCI